MIKPELKQAWKDGWRPPREIPMWKWCEENLYVPRRSGTPFPGKYSTEITPWVRGWFNAIQDPEINTIAIMKGAQVSATLTCYCALCFWICEDPDPILIVMPAKDDAEDASDLRIKPMIQDSPRASREMTEKEDDMKKLTYKLKQAFVRLVGSNSPGKLASFAHRFVILDEADKYKESLGKEGSVIGLALQRTKNFWNRKRIIPSTPTTAAGYINQMYLLGDQRKFFVPCPHCGHFQVLVWSQVKFDSDLDPIEAAEGAYYECESCNTAIYDYQKREMIDHGEWRATAEPQRSGYVSFHLSGMYSFSDECSFKALVEKFLTVKDKKAELQDFINSDLGELWEDQPKKSLAQKQIWHIMERNRYDQSTIPTVEPVILGMTTDVQQSHIVYQVWAFGEHDMWLITNGICSDLDDLKPILEGPYLDANEKEYYCQVQMLDTGHRTTECYSYCLKRGPRCIPIKGEQGVKTSQTTPIRPQKLEYYPSGKAMPIGRSLVLRHIHPRYFKDDLAEVVAPVELGEDEDELMVMSTMDFRIHFHSGIDSNFVSQITGEILMEDKPDKAGNVNTYWKKIRKNDDFDCAQYAMALRFMLREDLRRLSINAKKKETAAEKGAERERETKKSTSTAGNDRKARDAADSGQSSHQTTRKRATYSRDDFDDGWDD